MTQTDKIIKLLGKKTMHYNELAKLSKFPAPSVRRVLGQGEKRGIFTRVKSGEYKIK